MKSLALAATLALAAGSTASAANLVTNGSFETSTQAFSHEFGASYIYGQSVTGWTSADPNTFNLWFSDAVSATTVDADTRFKNDPPQFLYSVPGPVPDGSAFVALEGDQFARGALTQLISGLTIGTNYTLTFSWAAAQYANRSGPTTEQLLVGFGDQSFLTDVVANPSMSSTGWFTVSHAFTATGTEQLLSFLSIGTPSGLPPVALLDNVSLTGGVPEPAAWALMILGFGGVGGLARRRRTALSAA